ncbi:MAG: NUDIX domain-containing protein [Chlorobi bacterium]|nr:NUDIX domain-containing protein [Chlorobiota bacterium]
MKVESILVEVHVFKRTEDGIKFLLLKRNEKDSYGGVWQMVTGRIEENEKAFQTALREVKEETGLNPIKLWSAPNVNSFYSAERDAILFIPVFIAEVDGKASASVSFEHSELKWVTSQEAREMLIWKGQRSSVEIICEYLTKEGNTLNFNEIKI